MTSFTDVIPPIFDNLQFWGGSGYVLKTIHMDGTIPYWACVSLTNVCVRTALLPVVLHGAHTAVKFAAVAPEVQFLVTLFQRELVVLKENGASPENRRKHLLMNFQTMRHIYKTHKINPLAIFASPLFQLPFFMYFAVDMRKIVRGADPELANELSTGGVLWFPNLTEPDPWFTLPILSGVLLYTNVELAMGKQSLSGETTSKSNLSILIKDVFQSFSLFIPSFMANSPAGTQIYLCTTFIFTLLQSAALRNNAVRGLVGLPPTDAPKPEAKLAKEFLDLFKREKEAAAQRGEFKVAPGKGTVLAPGFVGSMEGSERASTIGATTTTTTTTVSLPKPTMLVDPEQRPEDAPLAMSHVPAEVMEAANRGESMPRPIVMAPPQEVKKVKLDRKDIAKSFKKKRNRANKKKKGKRPASR